MKSEIERLTRLVETIVFVSRKNKEDIADIAITIGDDHIKRISDYENQISSILRIIDALAGQVSAIKEKLGIKTKTRKISVLHDNRKILEKKNIKMDHMEIHPKVAENLAAQNHGISEKIKKVADSKEEDHFSEEIKKQEKKGILLKKPEKIIHHEKIAPYKIKKEIIKSPVTKGGIKKPLMKPLITKKKIFPIAKKIIKDKEILCNSDGQPVNEGGRCCKNPQDNQGR